MITMRPCGACRSLVPASTGCAHWRPGESARQSKARKERERDREELALARAAQDRRRDDLYRSLGMVVP